MTKSRGILPPRHVWTREELALLANRFPNERTADVAAALGVPHYIVSKKASQLGIEKSAEHLASSASGRILPGQQLSPDTQYNPGHVSHNRGRKGWSPVGTERTRFKKGQVGVTFVPIGSLRVNSLGYLDRKISADKVGALNWEAVHRLVWKEANGPIPPGHMVCFREGKRTTNVEEITVDVLELVTRAEHARRNNMWTRYPHAVAHSIQLIGAVRRRIKKIEERNASQD